MRKAMNTNTVNCQGKTPNKSFKQMVVNPLNNNALIP